MQTTETVRASSGFHHSTRALAPGEKLPVLPSLLEQIMACRNGMVSPAANDDFGFEFDEVVELEAEDRAGRTNLQHPRPWPRRFPPSERV